MKYEDMRLIDIYLNSNNYIFPCDGDRKIINLIPIDEEVEAKKLTKKEKKEFRKMFPRRKRLGSRKV